MERTLLDLHKRFWLRKALFDPWQMQAIAQRLARANVQLEEFPQLPGNLTTASCSSSYKAKTLSPTPMLPCGSRLAVRSRWKLHVVGALQKKNRRTKFMSL